MFKVLVGGALLMFSMSTLGCASHNQKIPPPQAITDCHARYTFFMRQCRWLENGKIICNGVVVTPNCMAVTDERK